MPGFNGGWWRKKMENFAPTEAEYPFMAYPPLIRRAAECVSVQHQLSPELYNIVAHAAAALAVQGLAVLRMPDGRFVPLNLYFLILAATGVGKSPAFEAFFAPYIAHDRAAKETFDKAKKEYPARHRSWKSQCDDATKTLSKARQKGEPLDHIQAKLDSLIEEEPIEPCLETWLVSDTNGPAFLKRLAGIGKSVALAGDEGEKLLVHLYQYIADLCQVWSHGRTDSQRIGTGITSVIDSRVLTLLLLQPENFYRFCGTAGKKAFGMGVWARFLIMAPKRPRPGFTSTESLNATNEPIDAFLARITDLIVERERRIKAGITEQDVVELDTDAHDCWAAFDREMSLRSSAHFASHNDDDAARGFKLGDLLDINEFAAKASMQAARVAAGFAYLGGDTKVTLDTMERAIRIIRYHIEAYRDQFSLSRAIPRVQEDALRLETYLRKRRLITRGCTTIPLEFLRSNGPTSDLRRDEFLLPSLQWLEDRGMLKVINPTFGGKPYVDFCWMFKPVS
jgi:hypothetical protein